MLKWIFIVVAVLAAMFDIPTNLNAWTWRLFRTNMGMENCLQDNVYAPMMDMIAKAQTGAMPEFDDDAPNKLKACASDAINHPKSTVPFVLDEYQRLKSYQSSGTGAATDTATSVDLIERHTLLSH